MKKLLSLALAFIMSLCVVACSESNSDEKSSSIPETTQAEEVTESNEDLVDLNPKFSTLFSIEDLGNGIKKVVDPDSREFILVPKEMEEVPSEYADATVVRTPVENAVFLSSTFIASIGEVEDETIFDGIVAVGTDAGGYASVPPVAERIASGDIIDVGGAYTDVDYETIVGLNPDIVFLTSGTHADQTSMDKFSELEIPYVGISEYTESNYIARMEWCRIMLTFFNADEIAAQKMAKAEEMINTAKSSVEGKACPKVLFASSYDGIVTVTSPTSWVGNMIKDAGGDYILADEYEEGLSYSFEEFILKAEEADIIVWTSVPAYGATKTVIFDEMPLLADVPAVTNDKIYSYSDSFWACVDDTAVMFEDLVAVFYEDDYADRELTYFQKLAE